MSAPVFWSTPLKYCRWAARERPALFWSVIIGAAGPIAMPIVPPIRKYFGDADPAPIPVTYPGMTGSEALNAKDYAIGT
ncbi:NADH-ubiquinone oxidoreductase 9 subunit [Metarhizium anisopliae]|nr:NADH-ubiquinone oxidoreductase 9 subunit [Metarhizium anisopliae]KFG81191.1 putative NADH-ubiquinone oxidoreductase 9.5 kDa subunit [Metarhizium anisopliae]